jgi:hypothetical protein
MGASKQNPATPDRSRYDPARKIDRTHGKLKITIIETAVILEEDL